MKTAATEVGESGATRIPITAKETSIGRGQSNDIVLKDNLVSREHACVRSVEGSFFLRDYESRHGTFVNDRRVVSEVLLRHGDEIRIGLFSLRFEILAGGEGTIILVGRISKAEATDADGKIIALTDSQESTLALSVPSDQRLSPSELVGKRLECLNRVATALQSTPVLDDLLNTFLSVLLEVFQPDSGIILLREKEDGDFVPHTLGGATSESHSHTVVDYAVEKRQTILVADTSSDDRFRQAESVEALSIRAAICAPLIHNDRVLGAVYLDARLNVFNYKQEDLLLLNIVAANAAVAIENALLLKSRFGHRSISASDIGPLVAESEVMKKLAEKLPELGKSRQPLLVRGSPGGGKEFYARYVHLSGPDPEAPFVTFDCADYTDDAACQLLFAVNTHNLQASAPGAESRLNALKLARGGTLLLRHAGAMGKSCQQELLAWLSDPSRKKADDGGPRIIATTATDLSKLVGSGEFLGDLAQVLSTQMVEVPSLLKRKEDIVPLARIFLGERNQRSGSWEQSFDRTGIDSLLKLRYRGRNAEELREIVDLASLLADRDEIGAEHIFAGPQGRENRLEADVGAYLPLTGYAGRAARLGIKACTLVVMAAIVLVCLIMPETAAGRVANALVWGLWWPSLMLLFLFAGRIWCFLCPISSTGRLAGMVKRLDLKPPAWMKKHAGWIATGMFFLIVWSEMVFDMPHAPFATGLLLTSLAVCAIVFVTLFERETWCRHVCPLGALGGSFSVSSMLQVHSNPSLCTTVCKTHDCFKGSEEESGCPMSHHPLYVRDSQYCKLCMQCLDVCPHGSAKLYVRPFLQDVWKIGELDASLLPFTMSVILLPLALLMSQQGWAFASSAAGFTVLTLISGLVGVVLSSKLGGFLSSDADPILAGRIGFAAMLLAWGPFMAFHLEHIPGLLSLRLSGLEGMGPESGIAVLPILRIGVVLFASLLALVTAWRVRAHFRKSGGRIRQPAWAATLAFGVAYTCCSILMSIPAGE